MVVTLYVPGKPARNISPEGYALPDPNTGFARVTDHVARELGCALGMEDVYDCGPDFAAYTIFDYEGEINEEGTAAIMNWSKHPEIYRDADADSPLCGPLLLVTRE